MIMKVLVTFKISKGFAQREDVAKARSEAGVEVESTETLSVISKDKFW